MHEVISVVMPTFNPDKKIKEALASIFEQTLPMEVIVVDDGSNEDISKYFEEYKNKVILIKQENKGVAAARNTGLYKATGKYIAFLDDDDKWTKDSLKIRIDKLLELKAKALVSMPYSKINENGQPVPWLIFDDLELGGIKKITYSDFYYYNRLYGYFVLQGFIGERALLCDVGGFDEDLFANEDNDLFARIMESNDFYFYKTPTFYRTKANLTANIGNIKKIREAQFISMIKYIKKYESWEKADKKSYEKYFDMVVRQCIKHNVQVKDKYKINQLNKMFIKKMDYKNIMAYFYSITINKDIAIGIFRR